jgi:hypothetical protein
MSIPIKNIQHRQRLHLVPLRQLHPAHPPNRHQKNNRDTKSKARQRTPCLNRNSQSIRTTLATNANRFSIPSQGGASCRGTSFFGNVLFTLVPFMLFGWKKKDVLPTVCPFLFIMMPLLIRFMQSQDGKHVIIQSKEAEDVVVDTGQEMPSHSQGSHSGRVCRKRGKASLGD